MIHVGLVLFSYTGEHYVLKVEKHSTASAMAAESKHLNFKDALIRFDSFNEAPLRRTKVVVMTIKVFASSHNHGIIDLTIC